MPELVCDSMSKGEKSAQRPKVMVVEDEFVAAATIKSSLQKNGFDVGEIVALGEEVLEQARVQRPDLVLMDVELAGRMDGIAAADLLREQMDVSIIFLTAYHDAALVERSKSSGPYGYLVKPININELIIAIKICLNRKDLERQLRRSEERYRTIVEDQTELICRLDPALDLTFHNQAFERYFADGDNALIGKAFLDHLPESAAVAMKDALDALSSKHPERQLENNLSAKDGQALWLHWNLRVLTGPGNEVEEYQLVGRDVTDIKSAQRELARHRDHLELLVEERTAELLEANKALQEEVARRSRAQKSLEEKRVEVLRQAKKLREANITLRYLLKQGEADKQEIEERVIANLKDLVLPHIEDILSMKVKPVVKNKLELALANLKDIVSPFGQRLSSALIGLTPMELKVADLVKFGKTNKEVAEMLHVSPKTVEFHREGIRKKLGIKNHKVNLQSYLRNMTHHLNGNKLS